MLDYVFVHIPLSSIYMHVSVCVRVCFVCASVAVYKTKQTTIVLNVLIYFVFLFFSKSLISSVRSAK